MQNVLVDSGFFIGLFDGRDQHHERCKIFLRGFSGRLLTTWPVITESLALLNVPQQQRLLSWLSISTKSDLIRIICTEAQELDMALVLSEKYQDQPMDFADASLYLLALKTGIHQILSVDQRDFAVYRLPGGKAFKNLLTL